MKARKTSTTFLLAVLLVAGVVACDDIETEYVYAPTISVGATIVTASEGGGSNSVSYSIKNPTDDGETTASASASWISNIDCSTAGIVTFSVSENPNSDARTGRVTITYSYSIKGSKGTASAEVTIVQGGVDQPFLSVQPTAIATSVEGGSYSFNYTVVNSVDDGELSATATASWISDISVANGTVSFSVEASAEAYMRSAEINLSYAYSNGTLTEYVIVTQDYEANGDGGTVDVSDIVGTYTATGYAYNVDYDPDNPGNTPLGALYTWVLRIYADEEVNGGLIFSGLTPDIDYLYYYGYEDYVARGVLGKSGDLLIAPQYTGYRYSGASYDGWYVCWITCPYYDDAQGWYYTTDYINEVRFTNSSGTWTSDNGMFIALTATDTTYGADGNFIYMDVFAPGLKITRTSPDPNNDMTMFSTVSLKGVNASKPHTGARLYEE